MLKCKASQKNEQNTKFDETVTKNEKDQQNPDGTKIDDEVDCDLQRSASPSAEMAKTSELVYLPFHISDVPGTWATECEADGAKAFRLNHSVNADKFPLNNLQVRIACEFWKC